MVLGNDKETSIFHISLTDLINGGQREAKPLSGHLNSQIFEH